MIRIVLFWLFLVTGVTGLWAQTGAGTTEKRLRISVLTCGAGSELYASFGHTAIRISDSTGGTDEVYNYGTFDFNDPQFYSKFTLGKLLYFLEKEAYGDFLYDYVQEGRAVTEQVLHLSNEDGEKIRAFLENNLLPANRAYRYDFLFDNCATRVRDVFPLVLGRSFQFGAALQEKPLRFREAIDRRLSGKPWQRLGIDIILGNPVDARMNDQASMFLPDYLYNGLQGARYHGKPLVTSRQIFIGGLHLRGNTSNQPFWILLLLLLLVAAVHLITALQKYRKSVAVAVLFLTGLLGLQLLFMWLFTNHQSCAYNWNILWAFPLNVFMAFIKDNRLRKYCSILAIAALIAALVVHFCGIQQMPLKEIAPLLAALLVIYGYNVKDSISK
ncbi:DUF4105 domain-containing protein [Niabella aurantiaca]|uniref:Lnb N-terminal periplasmic domain-containing protein n=1 Tax=Niabella aurantiaca TaxID=379900 RepID=UPI0003769F03|nr:DUF4105 domain-containing protein [Niabella aurantiaca]